MKPPSPVNQHTDLKYTKEASAHHVEGTSRLGIIVERTGVASHIAILEPLGLGLDEQAILAVRQWKFQPAMMSDQPIRFQTEAEIEFHQFP